MKIIDETETKKKERKHTEKNKGIRGDRRQKL